MNISLPEALKEFVDGQIAAGCYSSVSEYVCELIRADEKEFPFSWSLGGSVVRFAWELAQ